MKKLVFLLILLAVGFYLYQGPLAPYVAAGEFPLKLRKQYEDSLIEYRGSIAVPKDESMEDSPPKRKGKVVVIDSAMHMEPSIHSAYYNLDETLRASSPEELGSVIMVVFVPASGGGLGAPHRLYWASFAWPSKKCLGFELVKTWPRNFSRADIKADYPDFVEKIKKMKSLSAE